MGRRKKYTPLSENDVLWIDMFSNNLKYIAKTKHMHLTDVARKLNISYYQMQKYMDGTVRPDEDIVRKIADILGCTVDDLTDETYCTWNYGLTEEEIARNGKRLI